MKTIKTSFLTLSLLLITALFVQAKPDRKPEITCEYVLARYVQCITQGETDGIGKLLDDSFEEGIPIKGKTETFSKEQIVAFFKANEGTIQNCTTASSFIELSDKVAIAKVELKYPDFTRVNYVTLSNTGNVWKITHISTSYK